MHKRTEFNEPSICQTCLDPVLGAWWPTFLFEVTISVDHDRLLEIRLKEWVFTLLSGASKLHFELPTILKERQKRVQNPGCDLIVVYLSVIKKFPIIIVSSRSNLIFWYGQISFNTTNLFETNQISYKYKL